MTLFCLKRKGVLALDPSLMCPKLYLQRFDGILKLKVLYGIILCETSTARGIDLKWWNGGRISSVEDDVNG